MRGQQSHLYLSVRGRGKKKTHRAVCLGNAGKPNQKGRALRELHVPGGWGTAATAAALQASSGRALPVVEESAEPQDLPREMVSMGRCGMPQQGCPVGQDEWWAAGHPTRACCLPPSGSGLLSSLFHAHPNRTPTQGAF